MKKLIKRTVLFLASLAATLGLLVACGQTEPSDSMRPTPKDLLEEVAESATTTPSVATTGKPITSTTSRPTTTRRTTTTTTRRPTTSTTSPSRAGEYIHDQYWGNTDFFGDASYFVEIRGIPAGKFYCEAHLTQGGRRTGTYGNELDGEHGGRMVVEIYFANDVDSDGVEIKCN